MDHVLARSLKMQDVPVDDAQSSPAWCLMLGPMPQRGHVFYGWTIEQCLQTAEQRLL